MVPGISALRAAALGCAASATTGKRKLSDMDNGTALAGALLDDLPAPVVLKRPAAGGGAAARERDRVPGSRRAQKAIRREERQAMGAAAAGRRPGPLPGSTRDRRANLRAEREAMGAAAAGRMPGPLPGSRLDRRANLRAERAAMDAAASGRMPLPTGRRATNILLKDAGDLPLREGPPFVVPTPIGDPVAIRRIYKTFVVDWEAGGLSNLCAQCMQLTPGHHSRLHGDGRVVCEACRAQPTRQALPPLAPIPEAMRGLNYVEQRLLAQRQVSQFLVELPSGGPTGQWGRMYVTALEQQLACEALDGASIGVDGEVRVLLHGASAPSPARAGRLHAALSALRAAHPAYATPRVDSTLALLEAAARQHAERDAGIAADAGVAAGEVDYIIAGAPAAPSAASLIATHRGAAVVGLETDIDTLIFPHLFPTGAGGFNDAWRLPLYVRGRLLGPTGRFEEAPEYIYWLLEMWLKRAVSSMTQVCVGRLRSGQGRAGGEGLRHAVYATLRGIPGTQPYMYTKRSMALSMYDQLGKPHWFLTLTCHARQPAILLSCIYAELHRRGAADGASGRAAEVRGEAIDVLHRYLADEGYAWDGRTANQLCNSHPAIVARQFFHQLRKFMRWLSSSPEAFGADPLGQTGEAGAADEADDGGDVDAPCVVGGDTFEVQETAPPFEVSDFIVRIEWQKRGYPHAHILLWTPLAIEASRSEGAAAALDLSDEEQLAALRPRTTEELCDKYIVTTSPCRWAAKAAMAEASGHGRAARQLRTMEELSKCEVHRCSPYCGRYTVGACRFGFPHAAEERTRRRTSQEQWATRCKGTLAVRRRADAAMMGQYNPQMLRKWRGSMDLQAICDLSAASKYILGYQFKSEADATTARRVEQLIYDLTARGDLNRQAVYRAAHTALQGRTTSTFEACHLLLGLPVVQFSRGNVWVQVGSPGTWVRRVPHSDLVEAMAYPGEYAEHHAGRDPGLPAAHWWYARMQEQFGEQSALLPVEGRPNEPIEVVYSEMTFFDFCAGLETRGKERPRPRRKPAIVGHRNFSPDLEPEEFYYSKLLLHFVWQTPGGWLCAADGGSHARAFQRIAADVERYPDFLRSRCFPRLDGTVEAARALQKVQVGMYLKFSLATAGEHSVATCVEQTQYEDALRVMESTLR